MRPFVVTAVFMLSLACSRPEPVPPVPPVPPTPVPPPATELAAPAAPAPAPVPAAAAPAPAPAPAATRVEVATLLVPGLDALVATNMAAALAAVPGVTKARPRIADDRFEVEFTPPTAGPDAIVAALKAVSPAVTLETVKPVAGSPAPEGGCGSCPLKDSCSGSTEPTHGAH
jgi:2-oxoglutarate dehydrogenase E2 component (dihydrolipoamide succinyltransferase)